LRGLLLKEEEIFNLLDLPQTKTEDRRKMNGRIRPGYLLSQVRRFTSRQTGIMWDSKGTMIVAMTTKKRKLRIRDLILAKAVRLASSDLNGRTGGGQGRFPC